MSRSTSSTHLVNDDLFTALVLCISSHHVTLPYLGLLVYVLLNERSCLHSLTPARHMSFLLADTGKQPSLRELI